MEDLEADFTMDEEMFNNKIKEYNSNSRNRKTVLEHEREEIKRKRVEHKKRLLNGKEVRFTPQGVMFTEDYFKTKNPTVYPYEEFNVDFKVRFLKEEGTFKEKQKINMVTLLDGEDCLFDINAIKGGMKVYVSIAKAFNRCKEDLIVITNDQLSLMTGFSISKVKSIKKELVSVKAIYLMEFGKKHCFSINPNVLFNDFKSRIRTNIINELLELEEDIEEEGLSIKISSNKDLGISND